VTSQPQIIRVLIVDDHTIVRRGIKALLAQMDDVQVTGEADNGLDAIRLSQELEPHVILMDLLMPKMDGIEATRQITNLQPHMRVLVMTSFVFDEKIFPAMKAGALGYLLKESGTGELIGSIYKVHRGELPLPAKIALQMMKEIVETPRENPTPDPLTAREGEVLRLLAEGLSNEEVAARLAILDCSVRTHINHIMAKLHLANRVQAALYALQEGISSLDEEIKHAPGNTRATVVGPTDLSPDNHLMGQSSQVKLQCGMQ
jgi:two-component system, NarL family, response regulator LiaR